MRPTGFSGSPWPNGGRHEAKNVLDKVLDKGFWTGVLDITGHRDVELRNRFMLKHLRYWTSVDRTSIDWTGQTTPPLRGCLVQLSSHQGQRAGL
jgi:hypothetical protein